MSYDMILGGPLTKPYVNPEEWTAALLKLGFRAAYCPVDEKADEKSVKAFADAADRAGIVIAEVGVWNNPISPVEPDRKAALQRCKDKLALADRIGAKCCVTPPDRAEPNAGMAPTLRIFHATLST